MVFNRSIDEIAEDYRYKTVEYPNMEYEKYFLIHPYHLDGQGWMMINKEIYKF